MRPREMLFAKLLITLSILTMLVGAVWFLGSLIGATAGTVAAALPRLAGESGEQNLSLPGVHERLKIRRRALAAVAGLVLGALLLVVGVWLMV